MEQKYVCVDDLKQKARLILPSGDFNYIESGAEDEITKARNQSAFLNLVVIPRVLRDVTEVDLSVTLFGKKCNMPFGFTSWAANKLVNRQQGELIPARVAAKNRLCFVLSTLSNVHPLEIQKQNKDKISNSYPNPTFLQLLLCNQQSMNNRLIQLAEQANFDGIVITVDTQVLGIRNKELKNKPNFQQLKYPILQELQKAGKWPQSSQSPQMQFRYMRDLTLDWAKIKRIRERTKLKVILKGIMNPKDAVIAADYCDAIYISNHGGRQLDNVPSTIQMLPKIRAVLNKLSKNRPTPYLLIDGGIRSGLDIFKCIGLGADYVFLGRPVAYGLASGEKGVQKLVDILKDELERGMILSGVENIKGINSQYIGFRTKL